MAFVLCKEGLLLLHNIIIQVDTFQSYLIPNPVSNSWLESRFKHEASMDAGWMSCGNNLGSSDSNLSPKGSMSVWSILSFMRVAFTFVCICFNICVDLVRTDSKRDRMDVEL